MDDVVSATETDAGPHLTEAHLALLDDPELLQRSLLAIGEGHGAAFAYRRASRSLGAQLAALEDPRLRERAADLRDLERQMLARFPEIVMTFGTPAFAASGMFVRNPCSIAAWFSARFRALPISPPPAYPIVHSSP